MILMAVLTENLCNEIAIMACIEIGVFEMNKTSSFIQYHICENVAIFINLNS